MNSSTPGKSHCRQTPYLPAEEGVWAFIIGDLLVFSLFFGLFLYYRAWDIALFQEAQRQLNTHYGLVNTLLLLTSSLLVALGLHAYRQQQPARTTTLFMAALLCGAGFSTLKILEYSEKIGQGFTMLSNDFFMFYFVFTGIHFFHVVLGMLILTGLIAHLQRAKRSDSQLKWLEAGALYWHLVDLLWIVLFPLFYLI